MGLLKGLEKWKLPEIFLDVGETLGQLLALTKSNTFYRFIEKLSGKYRVPICPLHLLLLLLTRIEVVHCFS